MVATGDGCRKGNKALGGFGMKPLGNGHLKINEAPILQNEGAFKKWLRMDDETIHALRTEFVTSLTEYVEHQFSKGNIYTNILCYIFHGIVLSGPHFHMSEIMFKKGRHHPALDTQGAGESYTLWTYILYTAHFYFCFWCAVRQPYFNNFGKHRLK